MQAGAEGGGGRVYVGMCRKTLRVPGASCGAHWAGVEGGRAWLWNPHFRCQLWGICAAAWMGKLTSSGYITVQGLDGN